MLDLLDDAVMCELFLKFEASIQAHHDKSIELMKELGAVLPGNTFWEREELRYVHTMPSYSNLVIPVRELLQNSSDAKTTEFHVRAHDIQQHRFVSFADTGRWCPADEDRTYDVCKEYFLFMNGSSKAETKNDGGFGVGRFIILFCAPLWFFTTRHMLVMGQYGTFQILCRRCYHPLKGSRCEECFLAEQNTPVGTVFYIGYKSLGQMEFSQYLDRITRHYLKFCNMAFPIYVENKQIIPLPTTKLVFQGPWFTVHLIESASYTSNFIVRSALGTPMFTRTIYQSESGTFAVDLSPLVNYTHFDQARRSLVGEPGRAFDLFIESRQGTFGVSANLLLDVHHSSQGVDPVAFCAEEVELKPNKSDQAEIIIAALETLPANTRKTTGNGILTCEYFFRNGQTFEQMDPRWRPDASTDDHILLILLWVRCLFLCLGNANFAVGFVFDNDCLALKMGDTYYVNPDLAMQKVEQPSEMPLYLWSLAVHETTHRYSERHDELFASLLTQAIFTTSVRNLETKDLSKMASRAKKQVKAVRRQAKNLARERNQAADGNPGKRKKIKIGA